MRSRAPRVRTTRLDRKIARRTRKQNARAQLRDMQRAPVSGGRLLLVAGAVVLLAAGAWWVNSLVQTVHPSTAPLLTHVATASPTGELPFGGDAATGAPASMGAAVNLDREDPAAVIQAWATAYLQRTDPVGTGWAEAISDFTESSVLAQLSLQAFNQDQILDGKAPTRLDAVEISDAAPTAEKNTPVRWSHTVTTRVTGGDGSVTVIVFGVVMIHTREGWAVTSVEEISATGGAR